MSSRYIPSEQPPTDNIALQEWLTRMMIMINAAIAQTHIFPPTGVMPDRITEGMVVNFNAAILPDITHAGPWIVIGGVWTSMT